MLLLMVFALVAGAATAASPCALPILPVVLAAGATGGRRRPLGLATGLVVSFTFATVALVYVIDALGLPDDTLRVFAIVVLAAFGASLVVPAVAARVEALISRAGVGRLARNRSGDGFGSGFVVGLGLGAVYAPCAGPILAGVITVSASQSVDAERLLVAASYGVGAAVVLYALALGSRHVLGRLRQAGGRLQQGMGVLMLAMAVVMITKADIRFQTSLANHLPAAVVDPAQALEKSDRAQRRLADLRGESAAESEAARRTQRQAGILLAKGRALPRIRTAPALDGGQRWFNTAGGRPLSLAGLRGRVVLLDFWTYSCINCIRTQPFLRSLDERYRASGLTVVGVHTPEFPFERAAGNVRRAVAQSRLRYPVVQDNDAKIWNAYRNRVWPGTYLVDGRGRLRYTHNGEGGYATTEKAVRSLLNEAGRLAPGTRRTVATETPSQTRLTPESYLGVLRAFNFVTPLRFGTRDYGATPATLPADMLAYGGRWKVGDDSAEPAGAGTTLDLAFKARRVFFVAGSAGGSPRRVDVRLDGRRIAAQAAGTDARGGSVAVGGQRLYRLVGLRGVERHRLHLQVPRGVSVYSFTFG